jgi:hypothetical protein
MTSALSSIRAEVNRDHVLQAVAEYDRLGPHDFFATHGYRPARSYELVVGERRYPHKAILGTAYELASGHRLDPESSRAERRARWRCSKALASRSSPRPEPRTRPAVSLTPSRLADAQPSR